MSVQADVRLPSSYERLHTGVILYEPTSGRILDANRRLESLFGYSIDELQEIPIDRYSANTSSFSEADFVDRLCTSAEGTPQQFRWRVKRADGELIWVQIYLSAQTIDDRTYVCAEVRDVTEYYNTSHREELFWRILRHDLRNGANTLIGYSEEIKRLTESDRVHNAAEMSKCEAMELAAITDSVKRIQQAVNQTDVDRICREASDTVREVVDELGDEYPSATIALEEQKRMWIQVDTAFEYALSEALENAVIHSDGVSPEITVEVGPSPNTGRVEISITDSNPPIPDAELDSLFDRAEVSSVSHGSGVGLFVMKWCIESLGGEITIDRHSSRGNAVSFYLPPKEPPEQSYSTPPTPESD
ncbi:PAS domain S-box-containing protein [Halobiforma haloterrestris]|uniref:histidine kinase n=1 Tax=Natronobacterium haloterrestre TaxID=148448 RepID=A0A1I1LUM6_NATHA|nr:PAS domain-containing sensor histidine kinase [Halobiforma haloterrestris]SFC74003.1 PAS domain S-box-containing protein [Halobiforma haloterrestris]